MPVQLKSWCKAVSFKHAATPLSAFCGTFLLLGGLALFETQLRALGDESALLFVGSFGALSTLIFAAPAAPLGIPYNTLLGHTLSVAIALVVHWVELAAGISLFAKVLSPSLAIAAMLACGVTNPPAAAIVVIFAMSEKALGQWGYGAMYLLTPALIGCAYAFAVQASIARVVLYLAARAEAAAPITAEQDAKAPVQPPSAPTTLRARARRITRDLANALTPRADVPPTVEVRCVDKTMTTAIANAVEGAAYVPDPLSYIIDQLVNERKQRAEKEAAAVKLQAVARGRKTRKGGSGEAAAPGGRSMV